MSADDSQFAQVFEKRHFATTQWSVVARAGNADCENARDALARLCADYWYPLYVYVRRRGHAAGDAQDLTQGFFTHLLEKQAVQVADPQRGKFRSFLLASMDHFLANAKDRARAQKRGGGKVKLSLDFSEGESRVNIEPSHDMTPQRLFERQWALRLLEVVVDRLEVEFCAANKSRQFELLKDSLTNAHERLPFAEIGEELGMTDDAVRQAAHRLRKRFKSLLRKEVARTVSDPLDVDDELMRLFESLGD